MITKVSDAYKKNMFYFIIGPLIKQIEAIFDLLIPLFMKAIIDLCFSNTRDIITSSLGEFIKLFPLIVPDNEQLSYCFTGGMIILIMGIVGFMTTMVTQYIASLTATNVGTEIRNSLYKKIISLNRIEREQYTMNHLLTVLNTDSYQVQQGVLFFIRLAIRAPLIIIGSLVISFILDWQIGLIFLAVCPLIVIIIFVVMSRTSKMYLGIQGKLDNLSTITTDSINGSKVIRAFNKQNDENVHFDTEAKQYQDASIKVSKLNALVNPLTFAVISIATCLVVVFGATSIQNGVHFNGTVITPSTLMTEVSYLELIFQTVVLLTNLVVIFTKSNVSVKRVNNVLKIQPSIVNTDSQKTLSIKEGDEILKFEDVALAFKSGGNYAIKNINFMLKKGESLGIIGGTGSGKSTLISLIMRFCDASKGNVFYKGINIKDYSLNSLREEIAYVPQKATLFEGTIKSNLLMANSISSEEEMTNSLKIALAYEFVSKYDDYLNHQVLENGSNFSGGQRQRLTIARALNKHGEVLILDDSTSALDLLTDKKVRENISSSYPELTKIIISQRVSTVSSMDKIIVMEKGQIIAVDTHENLMRNCPLYIETYLSQTKGDN